MLADRLGVSRTPVNDALGILYSEGLVEYAPHRGYVVKLFGVDDLMNAFDVRINLEGLAARRVAERGLNQSQIDRLEDNLREAERCIFEGAWTPDAQTEWLRLNYVFHDLFLEASGNFILSNAVLAARRIPRIHDTNRQPITHVHRLYRHEETQRAYREHVQIADAIISGQSDLAENMMKAHIFTNREAIRKHLASRGDTGAALPEAASR